MRYILFLLFFNSVFSQQNLLDNEVIWNFEFEQKTYKSIYHYKTKNYYSTIEIDRDQKKSKIVLRAYETGEILEVILDSSSSAKIPFFTDYFFSSNEISLIKSNDCCLPIYIGII